MIPPDLGFVLNAQTQPSSLPTEGQDLGTERQQSSEDEMRKW